MGGIYKILVTGPYNSGKTTFIGSISEIEVVSTERQVSGAQSGEMTTVAMDFGRITLSDGDVIHLYGTPGQERFNFMWEILSEGILGYVVCVDGSSCFFDECKNILRTFSRITDVPFVVAITRSDQDNCASVEKVRKMLELSEEIDVLNCDARDTNDVKEVLIRVLERVLQREEALERAG